MPLARSARQDGFTLLELLVVVTLVAVLAGMVVPYLGGSRGRDVADAARRLVLLVNRAQQEAALGARVWRLVLDPAEATYRFQRRSGEDFSGVKAAPFAGPHRAAGVSWGELTVNGQPAIKEAVVYLYPTGEQDAFSLTLRAGEHERTVVMDPVGRARLGEAE